MNPEQKVTLEKLIDSFIEAMEEGAWKIVEDSIEENDGLLSDATNRLILGAGISSGIASSLSVLHKMNMLKMPDEKIV